MSADGRRCPSVENAPQTADGEAAWSACACAAFATEAGMRVDLQSALALAMARGVAPEIAADLVQAVALGVADATAKTR